jgi:sulfate transporter 4
MFALCLRVATHIQLCSFSQRGKAIKHAMSTKTDESAESSGIRPNLSRLDSRRVPTESIQETPLLTKAANIYKRQKQAYADETRGFTVYDWFAYFIPALGWLRTYQIRNWLWADIVAGLSVAAMEVPQGMSYAQLAGLPQQYGLYGAFVPCMIYALLGSSRHLAVGPVAVTSTLLGNGLATLFNDQGGYSPCLKNTGSSSPPPPPPGAYGSCTDYQHAAIQIAFLAGLLYTVIGLLRLGWITYFLSYATVSGFLSGNAIMIALSQVKYITGENIPRENELIPQLQVIFDNLDQFSWQEFSMGMSFILILLVFRHVGRKYKKLGFMRALGPLTVCVLSIALMNIFKWYVPPPGGKAPIKNVGTIPKGLPAVTASWWFPLYDVGQQIVLAIVICLIDMTESISIAKGMAKKHRYRLNATQELRGLGIANLFGSLFNAYTTTGSFSRTAVNEQSGAKTLLSSFVTGIVLMFVLLFLTPVFTNMSANVQGAIIIVGVLGLFQYEDFVDLWVVSKLDWLIWVATFLFTMFLGVEIGILVGVALSLLILVYRAAFPRIATLGKLPETNIYRNVAMYQEAETTPGVLVIRVDAPLFYFNVEGVTDYLDEKLAKGKAEHLSRGDKLKFVVIDMSPSYEVDAAGIIFFADLINNLRRDGIKLILANPAKIVLLKLRRSGLLEDLGEGGVQVSVGEAVKFAQSISGPVVV